MCVCACVRVCLSVIALPGSSWGSSRLAFCSAVFSLSPMEKKVKRERERGNDGRNVNEKVEGKRVGFLWAARGLTGDPERRGKGMRWTRGGWICCPGAARPTAVKKREEKRRVGNLVQNDFLVKLIILWACFFKRSNWFSKKKRRKEMEIIQEFYYCLGRGKKWSTKKVSIFAVFMLVVTPFENSPQNPCRS